MQTCQANANMISSFLFPLDPRDSQSINAIKMGKLLQKKKNRSGAPKARPKNNKVLKNGRKKVNILGNAIIADNWYVGTIGAKRSS